MDFDFTGGVILIVFGRGCVVATMNPPIAIIIAGG
jgi:hypothetical protein